MIVPTPEDLLRRHRTEEVAWDAHEPEPRLWRSGRWSFELRGDELVDIRFDHALVLRSVRAVARNRDWGTAVAVVAGIEETSTGSVLRMRMTGADADLDASLTITSDDTALAIAFHAEARQEFWRNRLGLVVLHPPALAGFPLRVEHSDGTRTQVVFPAEISPHQPALDIRRLTWNSDDVDASILFAGDVFEMEDQRNWTDASFKTYSTPLDRPFPVLLAAGDRVDQSVTITCSRAVPTSQPGSVVQLVERGGRAPTVGTLASTGTPSDAEPIGGHLLVELHADRDDWRAALASARASAGPRRLHVFIVAADAKSIGPVLDALASAPPHLLAVYSSTSHVTEPALWDALVAGVAGRAMSTPLAGGARSHFTEFNRTHERIPDAVSAVSVSLTPQMHARERRQLVESIPIQRLVAEQTVRMAGDRPVHIGPVTLRPRFNAVATTDALAVDDVDVRQGSAGLGAWLIASYAALSVTGVESITWFEDFGERGVRDADGDHPVAHALRAVAELSGLPAVAPAGSVPEGVYCAGVVRDGSADVVVANLRSDAAALRLEWANGTRLVDLAPLSWRRLLLPGSAPDASSN